MTRQNSACRKMDSNAPDRPGVAEGAPDDVWHVWSTRWGPIEVIIGDEEV